MTEEQLREIEARAAAATKGPWKRGLRRDGSIWVSMGDPMSGEHFQADWDFGLANSTFTAHAREDVPALVAEVRRLQEFTTEITEGRE